MGEMEAARLAGMMAAKKEQIASDIVATLSAGGSQEARVAKSAGLIGAATLLSRVAGLVRDLGMHNIRVNAVIPGWIMTQRQIDLWLTPEAEAGLMQAQCLKEKLYPPDIARMVLWLASDDSRLVTAQNFVVDGGRM